LKNPKFFSEKLNMKEVFLHKFHLIFRRICTCEPRFICILAHIAKRAVQMDALGLDGYFTYKNTALRIYHLYSSCKVNWH